MHIADGILAPELAVAADALSIGALYFFGKKIDTDDIPKMGIMASALFVASLIHFPLMGTSMHLGLYGFAGILLGFRVFPVVFVSLLFQALIFQHGGLLSVGVNSINMGLAAVAAGILWRIPRIPEGIKAFLGGFLGIFAAAVLMILEFQLSGYGKGVFYLLGGYLILGGIEGMLTVFAVHFIRKIQFPLLERGQ